MTLLTKSDEVAAFCHRMAGTAFVTVDTEFIRERTFWPQLCVLQLGGPDEAVAIDTLAPGMDLSPVYELMADETVVKVFHAARQDVEIFHHQGNVIPTPLFDTQVAAMVCGFGESVSYETLVAKLAKTEIDKSSRFTDWAHRPLTPRQIGYALADVIHLRTVYEKLAHRLEENDRTEWLREEMAVLTDTKTYRMEPSEAWRRLKTRSRSRRLLAILREIAAWREREAQTRDLPRNRIMRDEGLLEIAAHAPSAQAELARCRSVSRGLAEGPMGVALLEAVARGAALPKDACPEPAARIELPAGAGPVVELLKVLLRMKCEEHHVARRLVASSADLEMIAADDAAAVPALHGWRAHIFGEDALALKHGRVALAVVGGRLRAVALDRAAARHCVSGRPRPRPGAPRPSGPRAQGAR